MAGELVFTPGSTASAAAIQYNYRGQALDTISKIGAVHPGMGQALYESMQNRGSGAKGFFSGIWGGIAKGFSQSMKPFAAINSAIAEPFVNEPAGEEDSWITDIVQGAQQGWSGGGRTFKDVLESHDIAHGTAATVGGLILDIVLDPTTFLGVGKLGQATEAVITTASRVSTAGLKDVSQRLIFGGVDELDMAARVDVPLWRRIRGGEDAEAFASHGWTNEQTYNYIVGNKTDNLVEHLRQNLPDQQIMWDDVKPQAQVEVDDALRAVGVGRLRWADREELLWVPPDTTGRETIGLTVKGTPTKTGGRVPFGQQTIEFGEDLHRAYFDTAQARIMATGDYSEEGASALAHMTATQRVKQLGSYLQKVIDEEADWLGQVAAEDILRYGSMRGRGVITSPVTGKAWAAVERQAFVRQAAEFTPKQLSTMAEGHWLRNVATDHTGNLNRFFGRNAAAALGGVRFKFGVPFVNYFYKGKNNPWIGYRWQTAAFEYNGRANFRIGPLFRGLSGLARIDQAIEHGVESMRMTTEHRDVFLQKGLGGLRQYMANRGQQETFDVVFGDKLVSNLTTVSERLGKLTEAITPTARAYRRGGWYGYHAWNKTRTAKEIQLQYLRKWAEKEDEWAKVAHTIEKTATPEDKRLMTQYLDGFFDDVERLPEYARASLVEIRETMPLILEDGRQLGAEVGDLTEVFIRTRAAKAAMYAGAALDAVRKQITDIETRLKMAEGGKAVPWTDEFGQDIGVPASSELASAWDSTAKEVLSEGRYAEWKQWSDTPRTNVEIKDYLIRQVQEMPEHSTLPGVVWAWPSIKVERAFVKHSGAFSYDIGGEYDAIVGAPTSEGLFQIGAELAGTTLSKENYKKFIDNVEQTTGMLASDYDKKAYEALVKFEEYLKSLYDEVTQEVEELHTKLVPDAKFIGQLESDLNNIALIKDQADQLSDIEEVRKFLSGIKQKDITRVGPESVKVMRQLDDDIRRLEAWKDYKPVSRALQKRIDELTKTASKAGDEVAPEVTQELNHLTSLKQDLDSVIDDGLNTLPSNVEAINRMEQYDTMRRALGLERKAEKATPYRYLPRTFTKEMREAIFGVIGKSTKKAGLIKSRVKALERKLTDMSFEEAVAYVKENYPQAKNVARIFEDNPLLIYASYIDEMADAVYQAQLGKAAQFVMKELGAIDNGRAIHLIDPEAKDILSKWETLKTKMDEGVKDKDTHLKTWIDDLYRLLTGPNVQKRKDARAAAEIVSKDIPVASMGTWSRERLAEEFGEVPTDLFMRLTRRGPMHVRSTGSDAIGALFTEGMDELKYRLNSTVYNRELDYDDVRGLIDDPETGPSIMNELRGFAGAPDIDDATQRIIRAINPSAAVQDTREAARKLVKAIEDKDYESAAEILNLSRRVGVAGSDLMPIFNDARIKIDRRLMNDPEMREKTRQQIYEHTQRALKARLPEGADTIVVFRGGPERHQVNPFTWNPRVATGFNSSEGAKAYIVRVEDILADIESLHGRVKGDYFGERELLIERGKAVEMPWDVERMVDDFDFHYPGYSSYASADDPLADSIIDAITLAKGEEAAGQYLRGGAEVLYTPTGLLGGLPEELRDVMAGLAKESNRMEAKLKGINAKPLPALKKISKLTPDMAMFTKLEIPGLEDYAMHPIMAEEFNRAWNANARAGATNPLHRWWREWVNGPWKQWATLYWPGFHVTNNIGAAFNNWLGGVTRRNYEEAMEILTAVNDPAKRNKIWRKSVTIDGEEIKDATYADAARLLLDSGSMGFNFQAGADIMAYRGSLATGQGTLREHHRVTRWLEDKTGFGVPNKVMKNWRRLGMGATTMTENWHRTAAFLQGLEQAGGDFTAARAFTMMRHGDYEELTDAEQVLRDIIPFYKWMRTNVPFQVRQYMETPGKVHSVQDIQNALLDPEDRGYLPDWMDRRFLVPFGGGRVGDDNFDLISLDLPMHQLNMGIGEFFGSFLPVVKPFFENAIGQSLFTGAPLTGTNFTKGSKIMQVPGVKHALDFFGIGERGADGSLYISDKTNNVLSIMPLYARFRDFLTADDERMNIRMTGFAATLASSSGLVGLPYRQIGLEELNEEEARFFYEEVKPVADALRELGYTLPSAEDYAGMSAPILGDPSLLPNPAGVPAMAGTSAVGGISVQG